jgi:hypothetical protein
MLACSVICFALQQPPSSSSGMSSKPVSTHGVLTDARSETLANLWQMTLRAGVEDALCLVELRGLEPLTPCMPCHPHHFTQPSVASPDTTSVPLKEVEARGAVM